MGWWWTGQRVFYVHLGVLVSKILCDLNAECPDGMAYGLVVVFDGRLNGDSPQDMADNAVIRWYATEPEMYAAWNTACDFNEYLSEEAVFKRVDDLASTQYAIVMSGSGDEEDGEVPTIDWWTKGEARPER